MCRLSIFRIEKALIVYVQSAQDQRYTKGNQMSLLVATRIEMAPPH